jgi:hypothetical protein
MRLPLVLPLFIFYSAFALVLPALAQSRAQQAQQLRQQLEAISQQLEALAKQDDAGNAHKVTEIGSATLRSREAAEPRMVVRIYDLSDLFAIAPSYPAREGGELESSRAIFPEVGLATSSRAGSGGGGFGGMGGMGGGFFAVPTKSARLSDKSRDILAQTGDEGNQADAGRTTIDDLIDTITTTIAPEEWVDVGGPASIKDLGASLVISAPVEIHEQVAPLLDLFRRRWGSLRTVTIQAHWFWLTEPELAELLADPPPAAKGQSPAFGALSDAAWRRLRELAPGDNQRPAGYHVVLTCYNGQTVSGMAGRQRLIVNGMTPVVGGQDSAIAYSPQVRAIHEGAALQVTPVVTRTAKYVVLDVHSRVNLPDAAPIAAAAAGADRQGAAEQSVAAIERQPIQSQRVSTTLRIPVGRPTLVGGMTFPAQPSGANLYLFVSAVVLELRDEEGAEVKLDP